METVTQYRRISKGNGIVLMGEMPRAKRQAYRYLQPKSLEFQEGIFSQGTVIETNQGVKVCLSDEILKEAIKQFAAKCPQACIWAELGPIKRRGSVD